VSEIKFKQIAQIIESRILEGYYPPNSKLPPHRILAEELDTTPVTVAKAYKLLAEQNRIESYVGRGTFVCGESKLSQVIQAGEDKSEFNFSILQPCLGYNLAAIQTAFQNAAGQLSCPLIGYAEQSGHEAHRQVGVQWAKKYGLTGGSPHNTVLTDGAQHGLSILIEALTKPGDTIAVEAQTYPGILAIASLLRRHVVGVDMDENGMHPENLQATLSQHQPKLVIVIPSHQNPTGITMPIERREAIAALIRQARVWLIEDDIYSFLNATPIPAICNLLPEYGFHVTSLSKAISPALRCGFIKAPEEMITTLNAHIRANIWLSSPLNYAVAADLMASGQAFELADKQRQLALQRQALARRILELDNIPPQLGYHLWFALPPHWQQERFVMEAQNHNILVGSGSYFDTRQQSNHIRLSLMSINSERRFTKGLTQLKTLLQSDINTVFPF
jgi:DNA-binding transcriptional MocR family regulator